MSELFEIDVEEEDINTLLELAVKYKGNQHALSGILFGIVTCIKDKNSESLFNIFTALHREMLKIRMKLTQGRPQDTGMMNFNIDLDMFKADGIIANIEGLFSNDKPE